MHTTTNTTTTKSPPPISRAIAAAGSRVLRTRWLMRAPIALFRYRLGAVFGSRMVLLEHLGRRSGAARQVVLEVFDHPAPGRYLVVSGFGDKAQWLRNVRANPRIRLTVGSRRPVPGTARMATDDEARTALDSYTRRHRRAWQRFRPILEKTLGHPIDDDTRLPMVVLELDRH